MADADSGWYSVRCVFGARTAEPWGPPDLGDDEFAYEERITVWRAASADDAIARAEEEARRYQADLGVEYLGIAQSCRLDGAPGDGAEVYSLVRRSRLASDPYLDTFFDTGHEYQQEDDAT